MRLEPLTPRQQGQIIENRLGSSAVAQLRPEIERLVDSEGATICGNPLMLSMVISIYQAGGAVFPTTRFELYTSAVNTMLTRLDFKDIAQRKDDESEHVRRLLSDIAASRQRAHDKDVTDANVKQAIDSEKHLARTWDYVQEQVMLGKLPLLSCLEPRPVKLRFAHLSLQEFLCVESWLKKLSAGQSVDTVLPPMQEMLNDGWWLNTLGMACEARPELAEELFGAPPNLVLKGLEGEAPLATLPQLIGAYLPATRSLDLR